MSLQRVGDLDIAEDMPFQRRAWVFQRLGWFMMLLIVVAALLGLCGSNGPLNAGAAGDDGGAISIRYARFLRHMSPTMIEIEVGTGMVDQGYARVAIARSYLELFEVDSVTPEPAWVQLGSDVLIYGFPVAGTGESLTVTFKLRPDAYGPLSGRFGAPDGSLERFRQFVYP